MAQHVENARKAVAVLFWQRRRELIALIGRTTETHADTPISQLIACDQAISIVERAGMDEGRRRISTSEVANQNSEPRTEKNGWIERRTRSITKMMTYAQPELMRCSFVAIGVAGGEVSSPQCFKVTAIPMMVANSVSPAAQRVAIVTQ